MGRNKYRYVTLPCNRGVNQQAELSIPGEVAEASNVWAPDGRIQVRPGYVSHMNLFGTDASNPVGLTNTVIIEEDIDGATTSWTVGNSAIADGITLVVGDRIYFGCDDDLSGYMAIAIATQTSGNTATDGAAFKAEYYNGTQWRYIPCAELNSDRATHSGATWYGSQDVFLGEVGNNTQHTFHFHMPDDIATTTVDGNTKYFIRLTISQGTVTAGAGGLELSADAMGGYTRSVVEVATIGVAKFADNKKSFFFQERTSSAGTDDAMQVMGDSWQNLGDIMYEHFQRWEYAPDHPGSFAVVPQTGEIVACVYGRRTIRYPSIGPGGGTEPDVYIPSVEDGDFAIGTGAPFDRSTIALLTEYPQARHVLFFKNRLWFANLAEDPSRVLWGAPVPYHRVFPALSQEVVEGDNSEITAMAALGEHVVIFKRDSIWTMTSTGTDLTGVSRFAPVQVVNGVGCVAPLSIQKIKGTLVFLAEDGIYAFDGTPNIQKLTLNERGADRLQDEISRITPGRRIFAAAGHWRHRNCYVLSVPKDGKQFNSQTLVWDYKQNAWWIWDIDAQHWWTDEDDYGNETLWFCGSKGNISQFDRGKTDHYATITSSFTTHRVGFGDNFREVLRTVEVTANNKARSLTVQPIVDDNDGIVSGATIDLTDFNENDWGHATDRNHVPDRRRARRLGYRLVGDHAQVKVTHSTADQRFKMTNIQLGFIPLGRR